MLVGMRDEAYLMGQDKEVQFMLTKEKYDQMDWLSYGNEREEKGADNLADLLNRLYAEGKEEIAKRVLSDKSYRG